MYSYARDIYMKLVFGARCCVCVRVRLLGSGKGATANVAV